MKAAKAVVVALVALLGTAAAVDASAHGRWRGSVGVFVGGPGYWYPGPYYYPYAPYPYPYYAPYSSYYAPYPYAGAPGPQEYVERSPAQPQASEGQPSGYWYYCRESNGYYPNVNECAGGWERVPPRPQS